jgi:two-component system, NarL family, sensor histidine kinase LiaS
MGTVVRPPRPSASRLNVGAVLPRRWEGIWALTAYAGAVVRRSGLRMRMAVSYVLVTAAAVVLVDGVVLGLWLPRVLASSNGTNKVVMQANVDAKTLSNIAGKVQPLTSASGDALLRALASNPAVDALGLRTGAPVASTTKGAGTARPVKVCGAAPLEALISTHGQVIASSNPAGCQPGTRLNLPRPVESATGALADGVVYALRPVVPVPPGAAGSAAGPIGAIYVVGAVGGAPPVASLRPLLATGGLALALVVPVGVVFGLLSTQRFIRRLRRLADVTTAVADGDFRPRVPVSGNDEIGQLEEGFNQMTSQLSAAMDRERAHAGADARQGERARIARELHDSISQDLFSLSLLAAGLSKALPATSGLRPEVAAMERTAARTMREMQALLLELRPVALENAALVPALAELCRAYEARLGIRVAADLCEMRLDPAAEHAVLRVTQEALGNAVRHADPAEISVRIAQSDGTVLVEVRDDGRGFDPGDVADRYGMGLRLMRERVTELGGEFALDSGIGEGTVIMVRLPAGSKS